MYIISIAGWSLNSQSHQQTDVKQMCCVKYKGVCFSITITTVVMWLELTGGCSLICHLRDNISVIKEFL